MKEWDKEVSTFLLKQAVGGAGSKNPLSHGNKELFVAKREWDLSKLKQYIGDADDYDSDDDDDDDDNNDARMRLMMMMLLMIIIMIMIMIIKIIIIIIIIIIMTMMRMRMIDHHITSSVIPS